MSSKRSRVSWKQDLDDFCFSCNTPPHRDRTTCFFFIRANHRPHHNPQQTHITSYNYISSRPCQCLVILSGCHNAQFSSKGMPFESINNVVCLRAVGVRSTNSTKSCSQRPLGLDDLDGLLGCFTRFHRFHQ